MLYVAMIIYPQDFSMQPPAQEIVARDLHNNVWTFRHIYRGNFFLAFLVS